MQFGVFENFTSAYLFQIAREKSRDYLLIIYVQKFQTNSLQFVIILPYGLTRSAYKNLIGPNIYPVVCTLLRVFVLGIIL